jgi:LmbE family N-acetylglucosaminyl deacetylase
MTDPTNPAPTHFDVARGGTPDAAWRAAACSCPEWSPTSTALLVIAPHPDDETLGAGGLMYAMSRGGCPVTVLSVTDGEAAYPDWADLSAVRARELDAALFVLGAGAIRTHRLHVPDGRVAQAQSRLREAIEALALPTSLLVAPYERDGHPDHEAVGRACLEIAARMSLELVRYPVWAWHHAGVELLANHRWVRYPLTRAGSSAKTQALQCFRSQFEPERRTPIVPAHVLPYFQRAYEMFARW